MKIKLLLSIAFLTIFSSSITSCSKDDDNSSASAPASSNLGTFVGNLQVADDPQTALGYVYNTKVTVSTNGSNATIKIVGDNGFNREFIGNVAFSNSNTANITIIKQIKPVEKNAGNSLVIIGNELTTQISLASDAVIVKQNSTSTTTFEISGKIGMIGTNMLRE